MIDELYNALTSGCGNTATSIESSVESHYIAVAAETSRLNGGKLIPLKNYRN